ncbi:MAG: 50S ribosomal protein L20 [Acidobacteriota bacterium]
MPRVKRGTKRRAKRKKLLHSARGYYGMKSRCYRLAKEAVEKAGVSATRDRRAKKRQFRSLWIVRINAAARGCDLSYSKLMAGLKAAGVAIDRKNLADLAVRDRDAFAKVAETAKAALGKAA